MHLGIVAQRDNPRAAAIADGIRRGVDARVSIDEATGGALDREGMAVADLQSCDLVVSIGGDGTFLFTAREVTPTPIVGVNLGEVGFLNAVSPGEAVSAVRTEVERFRTGTMECQELPQLRATGEGWSLPPAVNEVAILGPRRGRGGGLGIEARVDGKLYSGSRGDGMLLATPTGSTAYNLSEGGPLVHPDVAAFLLTEMCAESSMPPLAVSLEAAATIRVDDADHAFVVADGRIRERVSPPTEITVRRAEEPVRVAGPRLEFFAALGKLE